MRKIFSFALLLVLVVVAVAFGADATPVAQAAPVAAINSFQAFVSWMMNNQVIVGMLIAAILDFVFAINPDWKSNGALHMIYTMAKSKSNPTSQG